MSAKNSQFLSRPKDHLCPLAPPQLSNLLIPVDTQAQQTEGGQFCLKALYIHSPPTHPPVPKKTFQRTDLNKTEGRGLGNCQVSPRPTVSNDEKTGRKSNPEVQQQ